MNFNKRFHLESSIEENQEKFINRFNQFVLPGLSRFTGAREIKEKINIMIAYDLGVKYHELQGTATYYGNDFYKCLRAIESIYHTLKSSDYMPVLEKLTNGLDYILSKDELQITFRDGEFYPAGDKQMDQTLVNDILDKLNGPKYDPISKPYIKGLKHLLNCRNKSELRSDVITDMYEALEAAAQIKLNNTKDLSENCEKLIKNLPLNTEYKNILKGYITCGNQFRHAQGNKGKKIPSYEEAESFMYLTGIFLRLSINS